MRGFTAALTSLVFSCLPALASTSYTISTFAGGGPDGIPALEASFNSASGLAADADGNIYIADGNRGRIYRLDPSGIIHVLAGSGAIQPYPGCCPDVFDGGPATEALMSRTADVALDSAGNVYIPDEDHHRVRRVDAATGIITTFAGTGVAGFSGDGGPAQDATFYKPSLVVVDRDDNVFVADDTRHNIRRIDAATGIITTVAGNGVFGYSGDGGPATLASFKYFGGITLDDDGNLFIADYNNDRVRRVDAATGIITTYAGGGSGGDGVPADTSLVERPRGLTIGPGGDLYIVSSGRIRRVDAATQIITTWAHPSNLSRIVFDSSGNAFISRFFSLPTTRSYVSLVDPATGGTTVVAGRGDRDFCCDGVPGPRAMLLGTFGVALGPGGDVFVSDIITNRVRRISKATGLVSTVAGNGLGGYNGDGIQATEARLRSPAGLALDQSGRLYIADFLNRRVRRVDLATGIISTVVGIGSAGSSGDGGPATSARLNGVTALAFDVDDNLYIADPWNSTIRRVDAATKIITRFAGKGGYSFSGDGGPADQAGLDWPSGIGFDPNGNLLIADTGNNRIRMVDAMTGTISTVAGDGTAGYGGDDGPPLLASFYFPSDVKSDPMGNLFIADSDNHRIRRIDNVTGLVETIAGIGEWGFTGDGGAADQARISRVTEIALDMTGHVLLADLDNNRIRQLSPPPPPGTLQVRLEPESLWPPNGHLWDVEAFVTSQGDCAVDDIVLVSITSSETEFLAQSGDGSDGDIQGADFGTADFSFLLRAERSGRSADRTYTVTYAGIDCLGREVSQFATVVVPHDLGLHRGRDGT